MRMGSMIAVCVLAGCVSDAGREQETPRERSGPYAEVPLEPEEEMTGFMSFVGGEYSTFRPFVGEERWWLEELPEGIYEDYMRMQRKARDPNLEVYVRAVGRKSGLGKFGHLDSYDRLVHIDRVFEMRQVPRVQPMKGSNVGTHRNYVRPK